MIGAIARDCIPRLASELPGLKIIRPQIVPPPESLWQAGRFQVAVPS